MVAPRAGSQGGIAAPASMGPARRNGRNMSSVGKSMGVVEEQGRRHRRRGRGGGQWRGHGHGCGSGCERGEEWHRSGRGHDDEQGGSGVVPAGSQGSAADGGTAAAEVVADWMEVRGFLWK